ncbi:SRPBCC family protein [Nocardioides montaniterrae]
MPAFSTTRSTVIKAPAKSIHDLIADFHEWPKWSPWEDLDADLQRTYDGEGVGATYAWKGKRAGEGSMRFLGITAEQIDIALTFVKPFKAENEVSYHLTPVAEGTRVEWTMSGNRSLAFAVMGRLFFDKAIGKDFDKGLAALKKAAEQG